MQLLVHMVGCKDKSLLLVEAAEALYRLHKHEHQVVVGTPHLLSKLLPTVRQVGEITEKTKENLETADIGDYLQFNNKTLF